MDAGTCIRRHCAGAFSAILLLRHAVIDGGFDPHALRKKIEFEIFQTVRWDQEADAIGFRPKHFELIHLALVALADEVTQVSDSRCDYSSPPPPGEKSLLQQKHFRWDLGQRFFQELEILLKPMKLAEVDHAVLEVFALCLSLGFRGKYEALGIDGYEEMRRRVNDKLRLPPIGGPPEVVGVPWPRPRLGPAWGLWASGIVLLFCMALLMTFQGHIVAQAGAVSDALQDLQAASPKVDS